MKRAVVGFAALLLLLAPGRFRAAGPEPPAIHPLKPLVEAYPRPSPDGRAIVYVSDVDGDLDLYTFDLETKAVVQITTDPGADNFPSWSPDGERILFMSDRTGDWDVFETVLATGATRNLTHHPAHDFRPRYAPDGLRIVFDSTRDHDPAEAPDPRVLNHEIYTMPTSGGAATRQTDWPDWDMYGSFSPDGRKIAFARSHFTGDPERPFSDVWLKDLATGEEHQLTRDMKYVGYTQWSPRGDWIVFASDAHGAGQYDFDVYVVRPDGTDLRRLTEGGGRPVGYTRPSFDFDGARILVNRALPGSESLVWLDFPGTPEEPHPASAPGSTGN